MKVNRNKKSQNVAEVVEEVSTEVEVVETEQLTSDDSGENEAVGESQSSEPAPEVASVSQAKSGLVKITFLRDINPPPTVGTFDFAYQFKIKKITSRDSFDVPRGVACALTDAGAVIANL